MQLFSLILWNACSVINFFEDLGPFLEKLSFFLDVHRNKNIISGLDDPLIRLLDLLDFLLHPHR